jgi:hypothetical protein
MLCITGKNLTLFVFPSHIIIVWNRVHHKSCFISHEGLAGKYESSWDRSKCRVAVVMSVRFLPSPTFLPGWYEERATYIASWGTIPQYTVSLSVLFVTHWFSLHHRHQQWQWQLPSSSPLRKRKLTLFRLSPCLFLVMYLGFLEVLSNSSFERLWPGLMWSGLPPGHHNHLIEWTWAWWPHLN